MKFFKNSAFALFILAFFLGGCQNKASSLPNHRTVRLNLKNDPASLDPRKGADIISSRMLFLLFEGLVELNGDYSVTPAQAESYTTSPDGLVYTFVLKKSSWSNGAPVIAYDFEKAWKDVLDPEFPAPNAYLFYPIKNAERAKKGELPLTEVGIRCLDERTLQITLEKPTPYFLELIAFCSFFPVCSSIDTKNPHWAYEAGDDFVSNGPFVLTEWKHNHELVMTKNPLYWDRERNLADTLQFSMISDEMTVFHLFEKGELDMIGDPLCPLPLEALNSLKKTGNVHKHPLGATSFITFNIHQPPFHNEKIRKAFAYAINRQDLVTHILHSDQIPALNMIPPVLKGGENRSFFADNDRELAQKLLQEGLAELGLSSLPKLTFLYAQTDQNHQIAQAVQQQWKDVLHIDVALENLDFKVLLDRLCQKNYVFGQFMWAAQYTDPMNIFERFRSASLLKNYPGWENQEYVDLLEASFYETGEARKAILTKAEEIFLSEMPLCPLYHWETNYALPKSPKVTISPVSQLIFSDPKDRLHLAQGS